MSTRRNGPATPDRGSLPPERGAGDVARGGGPKEARRGERPTKPLTHFRAWPRRRLVMPTSIVDLDHGASFSGKSVDLGIGGARVDMSGPDPGMVVDTSVELVLSAPMRWDPLRVRGKVAWRGAAGVYGFRFEHASPSGLLALWEVLEAALD